MQLDVAQLVLNVLCVFGAQFFDEKLKLTTLESFIRLLFVFLINKICVEFNYVVIVERKRLRVHIAMGLQVGNVCKIEDRPSDTRPTNVKDKTVAA